MNFKIISYSRQVGHRKRSHIEIPNLVLEKVAFKPFICLDDLKGFLFLVSRSDKDFKNKSALRLREEICVPNYVELKLFWLRNVEFASENISNFFDALKK